MNYILLIVLMAGSLVIGFVLGWLSACEWHQNVEGDWSDEGKD